MPCFHAKWQQKIQINWSDEPEGVKLDEDGLLQAVEMDWNAGGWKWIGMQDVGDEDGNLQDCLGVRIVRSSYDYSSIFWLNLSVAPREPPKIKRIHAGLDTLDWPLEPPGMSDGSPLLRPVKFFVECAVI